MRAGPLSIDPREGPLFAVVGALLSCFRHAPAFSRNPANEGYEYEEEYEELKGKRHRARKSCVRG